MIGAKIARFYKSTSYLSVSLDLIYYCTGLKNQDKHKFNFYSSFCKEFELKFDCVVGENVTHNFPLHIHDSLCIGMITKGQRILILSENSEIIHTNEIFIINRNQPHAISKEEPHDYIAITIKGNGLSNTLFQGIINKQICVNLFLQLYHELKKGCMDTILPAWNYLYQYLTEIHQIYSPSSPKENFIRESIEYMQTNYQRTLSVDDIAKHACMSTYHFGRLFKQLTGLSPHNYLKQYRLSRSYRCLQQNTTVFDTAIETGFYDSSHFIKAFQNYMAVSPKEYQKAIIKQ